jgi:hypothetical protein
VARIMSIGSKNNFVKRFKIIFKGTAKWKKRYFQLVS